MPPCVWNAIHDALTVQVHLYVAETKRALRLSHSCRLRYAISIAAPLHLPVWLCLCFLFGISWHRRHQLPVGNFAAHFLFHTHTHTHVRALYIYPREPLCCPCLLEALRLRLLIFISRFPADALVRWRDRLGYNAAKYEERIKMLLESFQQWVNFVVYLSTC